MPVPINFFPNMALEIWVKDFGAFDPYRVFIDGVQMGPFFEQKQIAIPPGTKSIVVQFDGTDGGVSAVFDVATDPIKNIAKQRIGMRHEYEIP